MTRDVSVRVHATQSWLESLGDYARKTSQFRTGMNVSWRPGRRSKVGGFLNWQSQESSDMDPTSGFSTGVIYKPPLFVF